MMPKVISELSPIALLDRNKPGTPATRRAANTYLPGYGPAGGAGERSATKMLTGG